MNATASAQGACSDVVAALSECQLIHNGQHERIAAYLQEHPRSEPPQLADFLVREGVLTRFQADQVLQGRARALVLSQFMLEDVIGSGSMGTVFKARSSKDEAHYA